MRTGRPVKFILLFTLLFTITGVLPASAQQFTWQAALPAVSESGFYNIALSPEFVAKSNNASLGDVRIVDGETPISYILGAGTQYEVLPDPVMTITNEASSGQTIIQLQFKEAYLIQQVRLKITAPAFYKRSMYVKADNDLSCVSIGQPLISGQPATFKLLVPVKAKRCHVVIQNGDNPPLQVAGITAFQKQAYLTAWLEKGRNYLLKTGDSSLRPPVYDLPYFTNKLPEKIPAIEAGNIEAIPVVIKTKPSPATEPTSTIFKSKAWIWTGIICIILLISLLTIRLLRDMRERK